MVKAKPARKPRAKKAPAKQRALTDAELLAWAHEVMVTDEVMVPALMEGRYEAMYLAVYEAIEVREPEYNDFFSPWSNACTVFLRPPQRGDATPKWECAACGKVLKRTAFYWTNFVPFRAGFMWGFGMNFSPVLPAMTPVCGDHPLGGWPQMPSDPPVELDAAKANRGKSGFEDDDDEEEDEE